MFGPASDPAVAEHAEKWAGEPVETGSQALAFAEVMREHTLASTNGLTYAEMGRYQSADDPSDPKGTNDEAAAAKDENGQPISNSARDIWVTETALTTALQHGVHVRDAVGLQHRGRGGPAAHRNRARHPRDRGVRSIRAADSTASAPAAV